jgi:hypothetical protein
VDFEILSRLDDEIAALEAGIKRLEGYENELFTEVEEEAVIKAPGT